MYPVNFHPFIQQDGVFCQPTFFPRGRKRARPIQDMHAVAQQVAHVASVGSLPFGMAPMPGSFGPSMRYGMPPGMFMPLPMPLIPVVPLRALPTPPGYLTPHFAPYFPVTRDDKRQLVTTPIAPPQAIATQTMSGTPSASIPQGALLPAAVSNACQEMSQLRPVQTLPSQSPSSVSTQSPGARGSVATIILRARPTKPIDPRLIPQLHPAPVVPPPAPLLPCSSFTQFPGARDSVATIILRARPTKPIDPRLIPRLHPAPVIPPPASLFTHTSAVMREEEGSVDPLLIDCYEHEKCALEGLSVSHGLGGMGDDVSAFGAQDEEGFVDPLLSNSYEHEECALEGPSVSHGLGGMGDDVSAFGAQDEEERFVDPLG